MAVQTGLDVRVAVKGTSSVDKLLKRTQLLEKDVAKLNKKLADLGDTGAASGRKLAASAKGADSFGRSVRNLATAFIGLEAARSTFQTAVDRDTSERRLKLVAKSYGEVEGLQNAAARSAEKYGISQTQANKALANTFARLRPIGTSLKDIESVYNGFNTAAKLSGITAQESAASFRQLNQSLGSGVLRGDEFNSIAEQTPTLLVAISQVTGIAVGQLRDYAKQGNITSDIVIKALKKIEREGAGALEEALKGPQGDIIRFQNSLEDLQVVIASELLPVVTDFLNDSRDLIKFFTEAEDGTKKFYGELAKTAFQLGLVFAGFKGILALKGAVLTFFSVAAGGAFSLNAGLLKLNAQLLVLKGNLVFLGKVGLLLAPFIGVGAVLKDNADRAKSFEEALNSRDLDIVETKIAALTKNLRETGAQLRVIKNKSPFRGQAGEISDLAKQANKLNEQINELTRTRDLIIRLSVVVKKTKENSPIFFKKLDETRRQLAARGYKLDENGNVVPIGDGTTGGESKAAAKTQKDPLEFGREKLQQLQRQVQLQSAVDDLQRQSLEVEFDRLDAIAEINKEADATQKAVLITLTNQTALTKQAQLAAAAFIEQAKAAKQAQDQIDTIFRGIKDEIALVQAQIDGNEQQIQQLIAIRDLKAQILAINPDADVSNVDGLIKLRDALQAIADDPVNVKIRELKQEIADTRGQIVELGSAIESELATALNSAVLSVFDANKSIEESFVNMFRAIGAAFIEMATQMIAKALILKALEVFGTAATGGVSASGITGSFSKFSKFTPQGGDSNLFSQLPDLAGFPGRSAGGPVAANTPMLVGEDGPEIFMTSSSGSIYNQNAFSAAAASMNATKDAASVQSISAEPYATANGPASIDVKVETTRINSIDYVTEEQLRVSMRETIKQAEAAQLRSLRNVPQTRAKAGIN